jgi:hypothetical protein
MVQFDVKRGHLKNQIVYTTFLDVFNMQKYSWNNFNLHEILIIKTL